MNLALRWSFFVCTFSVDLKIFCYGWGSGGGKISEHAPRVVYETLKIYLERCMVMEFRRFD